MLKLKQAVIVEGRYDKARLSTLVDALIVTTEGFDIFRDREKLQFIRTLAERDGIIILTDSDAAGFRIRSYIAGAVDPSRIIHVYIPDILGKERRKASPSAEGKLGVEGIPLELLLEALQRAGVDVETSVPVGQQKIQGRPVTGADLMEWGIIGGDNSSALRKQLLRKLKLPARMNPKALLRVVNTLYDYETFYTLIQSLRPAD